MKGKTRKNSISFQLTGRYALFTDPITKIGGEKCSYHVPTYESLKGVLKSIYWKPTLIWYVDKVRVLNRIQTETKGIRPIKWEGGNSLAFYTFLRDVAYQVEAHFEWNEHLPQLTNDRIEGKHYSIAKRMLEKGGRQDIFLGVRDCQGYVEPCDFGIGEGHYDDIPELGFGVMFHGFDYPDETGSDELHARLWKPVMRGGVLEFPRPNQCDIRRFVRKMEAKSFGVDKNLMSVNQQEGVL